MKIAVIHSYYSNQSPSGENIVVDDQFRALQDAGHEVSLISRSTDQLSSSPLYKLTSAATAAGLIGASPATALGQLAPDIIHVHNLFPNWSDSWVTEWHTKIVTTLHNYRSICASGILWRDGHDCTECLTVGSHSALRNNCYRGSKVATLPLSWATRSRGAHSSTLQKSAAVVVLNQQAKRVFTPLTRSNIHVLPNFAGPTIRSAQDPEPRKTGPDAPVIFVGRLTEEKGVRWIINSWPRNGPRLAIVGSGPLASEIQVAAENDPQRFQYYGRLPPDRTRELIASSLALIIPSLWSEGIPTVALESLQEGTPILVSNKCSSAPEITNLGSGLVFDVAHGPESLHSSIRELKSNFSTMRRAALRNYANNFSQDQWTKKIERIYNEVIGSAGR